MDPSLLEKLFLEISGPLPVVQGLIGGLVITALNALGALGILIWRNPSQKFLDTALGFAAGAMLTASFTSRYCPESSSAGSGTCADMEQMGRDS